MVIGAQEIYGTANGVAEIFFQDNWLTGVVVLAAIAIGSRIAAGAVLIGSAIGLGTGMLLGASEPLIRAGLLGYNSALTGAAMGGFFVLIVRRQHS
jgi:urea transporter